MRDKPLIGVYTYSGDESAPDPVAFELLERSQSMQRGWRQVHDLDSELEFRKPRSLLYQRYLKFNLQKREGSVRTV